jgi:hypothetical protein
VNTIETRQVDRHAYRLQYLPAGFLDESAVEDHSSPPVGALTEISQLLARHAVLQYPLGPG